MGFLYDANLQSALSAAAGRLSLFTHSGFVKLHLFSKRTSHTLNKLNCNIRTQPYKQFHVHLHDLTFWVTLAQPGQTVTNYTNK